MAYLHAALHVGVVIARRIDEPASETGQRCLFLRAARLGLRAAHRRLQRFVSLSHLRLSLRLQRPSLTRHATVAQPHVALRAGVHRDAAATVAVRTAPNQNLSPQTACRAHHSGQTELATDDVGVLLVRARVGRGEWRHVDGVADRLVARRVDHVAQRLLRVLNASAFGISIAQEDELLLLAGPQAANHFPVDLKRTENRNV